jgi:hypothetical protein
VSPGDHEHDRCPARRDTTEAHEEDTLVITAVGAAILGLLGIPLQEKTKKK